MVYLSEIPADQKTELVSKVLEDYMRNLPGAEALMAYELIRSHEALTGPLAAHVLSKVAKDEPEMILAWLKTNQQKDDAVEASHLIGQELVNQGDPKKILDDLLEEDLPIGLKAKLIAGGVTNWLSLEEDQVFEHFSRKGADPRLDQAYYEMVSIAKSRDLEGAMEWAAIINDEAIQKKAILETAVEWQEREGSSYRDWKLTKAPRDLLNELP